MHCTSWIGGHIVFLPKILEIPMNAIAVDHSSATSQPRDIELLPGVTYALRAAGARLLATYSPDARPRDRAELLDAIGRNEEASLTGLRHAFKGFAPSVGWVDEEEMTGPLPPGAWWVVDAVEGNVNHVHGMPDWGISATLIRDGAPTLAVFHQPVDNLTWTAVRGAGADINGKFLQVSDKTKLNAAIVATGQAKAEQYQTNRRMAISVGRMLQHALLVRMTVPSTYPMLLVAAGQNDAFWQLDATLAGIAAGVLMVQEAGGMATCIDGSPWYPGCRDVLVAAPGVHAAAVEVLHARSVKALNTRAPL
jgi:myo-inositol-1(or 4)-monophosphatase